MQVAGITGYSDIVSSLSGTKAVASETSENNSSSKSDTVTISEQALSTLASTTQASAETSQGQTPAVYAQENATPSSTTKDTLRTASRTADGTAGQGETASFSSAALNGVSGQVAAQDAMNGSKVTATLNDGSATPSVITYSNSNGAITWNGSTLDLKGFANVLRDDVVIKNNNGSIDVYNLSTNQKMTLNADGTRAAAAVADFSEAARLSTALFINNTGKAANTGDANDIIINRQAGASIDAGAGDDKIFNYATTASTLKGGSGNDSVYSVGLTSGATIDVSSGNGYVKLTGSMLGGRITLGTGENYVDAAGQTLSGVTITDSAAARASAVVAKTISNQSHITLNAANTAVDAGTLSSSNISLGAGANSLVLDKITGKLNDISTITSNGTNTYTLGAVSFAQIASAAAKSDAITITGSVVDSQFHLSKGNNLLDASKRTLTGVQITSQGDGTGSTTIRAGAIIGRNMAEGASSIALAGSNTGNVIEVSGTVKNAAINTGNGAGNVSAGSLESVNLIMGGAGSVLNQSFTVAGKVNNVKYTGASGNDGLHVLGAVSNSTFDLGAGENSFTASNAKGVLQSVSNTNITASGSGSTNLTMGSYLFSAEGNAITLGAGANTINIGKISGRGTNGLDISIAETNQTQTLNLTGSSASYLTYTGVSGADHITSAGTINSSQLHLGAGDNSLAARNAGGTLQSVSNTDITATGTGSTSIETGRYTYGANGNAISLGAGENSITLGGVIGNNSNGLTIGAAETTRTQTLNLQGVTNNLTYNGSSGADVITATSTVSNSSFALGVGDNVFSAEAVKAGLINSTIHADGAGNNTIQINSFTTRNGESSLELGQGNDSVTINTLSGDVQVNMGGGNGNAFNVGTATGGTVSGAGGVYTIDKGSKVHLDFTGSDQSVTVNVQQNLANSTIDLGNGDTRIASVVSEEGAQSSAVIRGSTVNAGAGALTMDVRELTSSTVNMHTENAGNTARLNLSVNETMKSSEVNLGYGTNSVTAKTIADTVITRTQEGSLRLESENVSKSTLDLSLNGSDTITVTGTLDATILLGAGADSLTAGTLSGTLKTEADLTLNSGTISNLNAALNGNNTLTIGTSIENSTINAGSGVTSISQEESDEITLDIKNSTIESDGALQLHARNMEKSRLEIRNGDDARGDLDLKLTGALQGSTLTLGGGAIAISTGSMEDATISRSETGSLLLETGTVSGGSITLSGEGSDTLNVTGDMSATVVMGKGSDQINVTGVLSGALDAQDDVDVNADGLNAMNMTLSGSNNRLNVTGDVKDSVLDLGDGRTELVNAVNYSNTDIKGGNSDYILNATTYEGGSITLGNGNNLINVTESLSAKVDLGGGTNIIGTDATSLKGFSFTGTGSNTIRGKDLIGGSITVGGQDKSNQLLITGEVENSTITFNGGESSFGSKGTALKNTTISGSGEGSTTIEASSMTGGSITLGKSDDHVEVYGDIDSAAIDLGEGANMIRNTLGASDTDTQAQGQGAFVNNKVRNSKITLRGNTNVYLGDVREESSISGLDGNNSISIDRLTNSSIDASSMYDTSITAATVNGTIKAGMSGTIAVQDLQSGSITDNMGRNDITLGILGERAEVAIGEQIHSSTIHVDRFDGTLNLLNESYAGVKSGNITIGESEYAGTINIGKKTEVESETESETETETESEAEDESLDTES